MTIASLPHSNNENYHFKIYAKVIGKNWRYCILIFVTVFVFLMKLNILNMLVFIKISLAFVPDFIDGLGMPFTSCDLC